MQRMSPRVPPATLPASGGGEYELSAIKSRGQTIIEPPPSVPASAPTSPAPSARASLTDGGRPEDAASLARPPSANGEGRALAPLPPADGGRAAWSFLVAGTIIELIVWGLPYSVGVLHEHLSNVEFPDDKATVTLAATLQNGLLFVGAGFLGP